MPTIHTHMPSPHQRAKFLLGVAVLILSLLTAQRTRPFTAISLLSGGAKSPAAGQKTLRACGALRSGGHTYVLEQDISSPGTCISVQDDDITLDLNEHTITYGSDGRKTAAFGILGIACWDTMLTNGVANGNPCGGEFDGFTVMNGKIVQAAGVA